MTQATTEIADEFAEAAELTESEWHRLLANERRRLVLDVLADRTTPVTLDDLAAAVAAREEGLDAADAVESVKLTLYHAHLPKLADLGVLGFDPDSHRIFP